MLPGHVKKLHDGSTKQAVNDLVDARRRDGKLQKDAYTSIIDKLCKIGVQINRDALYKQVGREIPVEVSIKDTTTYFSSITGKDSTTTNTLNVNSIITCGHLSSSDSDVILGSKTAQSSSRQPKGSTNDKKQQTKFIMMIATSPFVTIMQVKLMSISQ